MATNITIEELAQRVDTLLPMVSRIEALERSIKPPITPIEDKIELVSWECTTCPEHCKKSIPIGNLVIECRRSYRYPYWYRTIDANKTQYHDKWTCYTCNSGCIGVFSKTHPPNTCLVYGDYAKWTLLYPTSATPSISSMHRTFQCRCLCEKKCTLQTINDKSTTSYLPQICPYNNNTKPEWMIV